MMSGGNYGAPVLAPHAHVLGGQVGQNSVNVGSVLAGDVQENNAQGAGGEQQHGHGN